MSESNGGCKRLFTIGCVGCLAVVALLIFIAVLSFGIAWYQAQGVEVYHQELTWELTAPEVTVE